MKVYRCDRCGNHYTQKEHKDTIDIFEVVYDKKQPRNFLCISPYCSDILDLCPDCMISLINWINYKEFADGRKFGYNYVEKEVNDDNI